MENIPPITGNRKEMVKPPECNDLTTLKGKTTCMCAAGVNSTRQRAARQDALSVFDHVLIFSATAKPRAHKMRAFDVCLVSRSPSFKMGRYQKADE